jgi:hypothetical protein
MHVAQALVLLAVLAGPADGTVPPGEGAPEAEAAEPTPAVVVERTVPFLRGKPALLNLEVGTVRLRRVLLDVADPEAEEGSILGVLRGDDAETSSVLRASFELEGVPEQPWAAEVRVELLDRHRRLIDRFGRTEVLEPGLEHVHLDRSVLTYVLPLVRFVRVRVEAHPDH